MSKKLMNNNRKKSKTKENKNYIRMKKISKIMMLITKMKMVEHLNMTNRKSRLSMLMAKMIFDKSPHRYERFSDILNNFSIYYHDYTNQ
jgi:hypothetical protein